MVRQVFLTGVLAIGLTAGYSAAVQADCRQALALGLDVSGSVDAGEYQMQIEGLAAALADVAVRKALIQDPTYPAKILIFEWSGPGYQRDLTGWHTLRVNTDIDALTDNLLGNATKPPHGTTSIGGAMLFAGQSFARVSDCLQLTLDISGDGKDNGWPAPKDARKDPSLQTVTVNGLVIGQDVALAGRQPPSSKTLADYYRFNVIQGYGAFVETADGFDDFQVAMTRKLLRELGNIALSALP